MIVPHFSPKLVNNKQLFLIFLGPDYQLLAASHSNFTLDSKTGQIASRSEDTNATLAAADPLINIDLWLKEPASSTLAAAAAADDRSPFGEVVCVSTFSTLDILLNPETISELIILGYSVMLNVSTLAAASSSSSTSDNHDDEDNNDDDDDKQETSQVSSKTTTTVAMAASRKNAKTTKIDFQFNRLSILMFRIEDAELGRARKIALFELSGVHLHALMLPRTGHMQVASYFDALNVLDMASDGDDSSSADAFGNVVFGIGLENRATDLPLPSAKDSSPLPPPPPPTFHLVYKRSVRGARQDSELAVQTASACYIHSSKLVHDVQCCLGDFMRFHEKIMQDVAGKATALAMQMFRKGQNYIENKIVDLYQTTTTTTTNNNTNNTTTGAGVS